jgi:hypothetical protein
LSCDSNLVYVLFSLIALFGLAAIADLTPLSDCWFLKKKNTSQDKNTCDCFILTQLSYCCSLEK